ncbi:MAG TPA: Rap1a/Tai family immunity protein [Rhizomicrobium sp.]|jgi:hypothetical protein
MESFKRRKLSSIAVAALLSAATPAHATVNVTYFTNGWDLYRTCGNALSGGFFHYGACHNFINNTGNWLARHNRICLSRGTTDHDLVVAVQDYMRERNDQLNRPARVVIAEALARAYPCRFYR